MARPKSEDKRSSLLEAAARVIDRHGLRAPTALIAKEAGVANGTLFNYFATKSDLLNHLYLHLKTEMAATAQAGLAESQPPREQLLHVWTNWMRWAIANPESRRAMAQLATSEEITPATREEGSHLMSRLETLIDRIRAEGPMRDDSKAFLGEITNSIAGATMDYMVRDPDNADRHCRAGFEALWRVVGGA